MKRSFLWAGLFLLGMVSVGYAEDKPPEFYNVESQVALKNLYMECSRLWAFEGPNQHCDPVTVNKNRPSFQAPPGVTVTVTNGTEAGFSASATHPKANKIVTIDENGETKEAK